MYSLELMELRFLLLKDGRRLEAMLVKAPESRDGEEHKWNEALPEELASVHLPALTNIGDDVRNRCQIVALRLHQSRYALDGEVYILPILKIPRIQALVSRKHVEREGPLVVHVQIVAGLEFVSGPCRLAY